MPGVKFPGFVERLQYRLRQLGYEQHGRIMWGRFAAEHGYQVALFGNWMKGATPTYDNLERLARDLRCELAWLLLGDRPPTPWDGVERRRPPRPSPAISGGAGVALPRAVEAPEAEVPLIGHVRRIRTRSQELLRECAAFWDWLGSSGSLAPVPA